MRLLSRYATSWKVASSTPDEVIECFQIYVVLPAALGPCVYSAFNRNEYQKQRKMFLGSKARTARKADNLAAICESIV
jgi:hypothetical protein